MRTAPLLPIVGLALVALPVRARTVASQSAPVAVSSAQTAARCPEGEVEGRCLPRARCGDGELDLDGLCVPMQLAPPVDAPADLSTNSHVDRSGRLVVYEHIPRRPDLPADYDRYEYPVPAWHRHTVTSGYDLGQPDALQRRGAELTFVGHGGVDLPQERGTPVHVVALRGEVGDPDVLYTGPLFGTTVLLRHLVREGGELRSYVALHGHLDAIAPGLLRGQTVTPGAIIGFVGDTGAIGLVHLHYETRLVRPGIDPMRLDPPTRAIDQEVSVPCDPRNLLPLRTGPLEDPAP